MKNTLLWAFVVAATCQQAVAAGNPTHSECVEMGIEYYKEIGSFPRLSTGEDAVEKVIDMCTRSPLAFGKKE